MTLICQKSLALFLKMMLGCSAMPSQMNQYYLNDMENLSDPLQGPCTIST